MENLARLFISTKQMLTTGMFYYDELPGKSVQFITESKENVESFRQWIDYIAKNNLKDIYLVYENNTVYIVMTGDKQTTWSFSETENQIVLKEELQTFAKKDNHDSITKLKDILKSNKAVDEKYIKIIDNDASDATSEEEHNKIIYITASGIYHTKGINSYFALMQIQDKISENEKSIFIEALFYVLNYYDLYFMNDSELLINYPASEDHVQSAIIAWQKMTGLPKFNLPGFIIDEVLRAKNIYTYLEPSTFNQEKKIGEPYCAKVNEQPCLFLMTSELSCDKFVKGSEELKKCITALSDEDLKRFLLLCQYHHGLSVMIDPPFQYFQMPMERMLHKFMKGETSTAVLYPKGCEPNEEHPLGQFYIKTAEELSI